MAIRDELIEELLKEYKNPEDFIGKDGIIKELTKRLIEKAMEGELTHQLGYSKHSPPGKNTGNSRNGKSSKTLKGELGEIPIVFPGIVMENLTRKSSRKTRPGLMVLMRRFFLCMPAA